MWGVRGGGELKTGAKTNRALKKKTNKKNLKYQNSQTAVEKKTKKT